MKPSRTVKIVLLLIFLLVITVAVSYILVTNSLVRCYLARLSDLDRLAPNIYIDPDMSDNQRMTLQASIAAAEKRIAGLYGEYTARPVLFAGHTMDVMETYGGNSYNRAGRTHLTLTAAFVILGPDGMMSVDVLSHELAHVEFVARIGHVNRAKVPNWFDEGLAVQFDDRYSEVEWQTRTDNGRTAPDLDQIGVIGYNDWLGYATAKHEVKRWLELVGQDGFWTLLESIRSGDPFQDSYNSIEREYTMAK